MFEIQFNSFEDFINFHNFQIIHAILAPIIYLFGIPSAMAFVYYEQNGGDPTKRSLQNILFAQVARSLAFYLFPGCFGFTWLIFFGPMNETLAWLNVWLRQFFETFGILYTTETMVIKVVMVYGWKYACCIDEAFFARFIFLFNFGFALTVQLSRWSLGTVKIYKSYEVISGTFTPAQSQLFWSVFILVNLSIFVIGTIAILWEKIKGKNMVKKIKVSLICYSMNEFLKFTIHA